MSETKDKIDLLGEIRYAERLCERTARLYRRIQAIGTFGTLVSGSAMLSAISKDIPPTISIAGTVAFALFGLALIVIRPAEKVAANDADSKRYAKLRSDAGAMDATELQTALNKAKESNTQEVEPLREIAYNDVARELGRDDAVFELSVRQKLLAALA